MMLASMARFGLIKSVATLKKWARKIWN
jgi:hypothetical protein